MIVKKISKTKDYSFDSEPILKEGFCDSGGKILSKTLTTRTLCDFLDLNTDDFCNVTEMIEYLIQKETSLNIYYKNSQNKYNINFDFIPLEYCYGIYEFGNLSSTKIPQNAFNMIMRAFLSLKGITFMVNTNGIKQSLDWERLLTASKMFTPVKKFCNMNSGNPVTIWISNNN